ncbi:MAG: hypothetical protein NTY38_23040, partial [Acidobacteria bacterium]|nr:hypothetical protein [Acidobacteriota bacterium]
MNSLLGANSETAAESEQGGLGGMKLEALEPAAESGEPSRKKDPLAMTMTPMAVFAALLTPQPAMVAVGTRLEVSKEDGTKILSGEPGEPAPAEIAIAASVNDDAAGPMPEPDDGVDQEAAPAPPPVMAIAPAPEIARLAAVPAAEHRAPEILRPGDPVAGGVEAPDGQAPKAAVRQESASRAPGGEAELAFAVRLTNGPGEPAEPSAKRPEGASKEPVAAAPVARAGDEPGAQAEDHSSGDRAGLRKAPEAAQKKAVRAAVQGSPPEVASEPAGGQAAPARLMAGAGPPMAAAQAITTEAAGSAAPASAGPPAKPAPLEADVAPADKPKAPASSQLSIRLERPGEKQVSLQVFGRAGQIHVAVRSDDSRLTAALRSDLNDLVSNLKQQGFKSETWTPAGDAMAPAAAARGEMNSAGEEASSEGGQHRQQQQQQRDNE